MDRADGGCFFACSKPRLRDYALLYPPLQSDIMKPIPNQSFVQRMQLTRLQRVNNFSAHSVLLDGVSKGSNHLGIRIPVKIFRWVECRITDYEKWIEL